MRGKFGAAMLLAALAGVSGTTPFTSTVGEGTQRAQSTNEARAEQAKRHNEQRRSSGIERAFLGGWGGGGSGRPAGYPRPGWSGAHGKRLARKARNQKRNRRAHRG